MSEEFLKGTHIFIKAPTFNTITYKGLLSRSGSGTEPTSCDYPSFGIEEGTKEKLLCNIILILKGTEKGEDAGGESDSLAVGGSCCERRIERKIENNLRIWN